MAQSGATIASILQSLAIEYNEIVSEREICNRVLAIRPSQAKNPSARIREELHYNGTRIGWVWLGDGTVVPLRVVLTNLRFRLIPSPEEVADGALVRDSLRPFVPFYYDEYSNFSFEQADGTQLPIKLTSLSREGIFGNYSVQAIDLQTWMHAVGFAEGDSLLLTITSITPFVLRIEHEPANQFRTADVAAQNAELLEALVARVQANRRSPIFAEQGILPIYATATWRTEYPGSPWRQLVMQDRRLRLIDGDSVADAGFHRPLDLLFSPEIDEEAQQLRDSDLLQDIYALQEQMLASRQADAKRQIWDGIAPRRSTIRLVFRSEQDSVGNEYYPGAVNTLRDCRSDIEEHLARDDYRNQQWDFDGMYDEEDDFFSDPFFLGMFDPVDSNEIQSLIDAHPELEEISRRLFDSLPPDIRTRFEQATSIEEAQEILAGPVSELLRKNPELFEQLQQPSQEYNATPNGQHHLQNGHMLPPNDIPDNVTPWEDAVDSSFDVYSEYEPDPEIDAAQAHSIELLQIYANHQTNLGRTPFNVENRMRDVLMYAEFLSAFYHRSLDQGDYATLDEFLFYYFPRRLYSGSARGARELCTSIKVFYGVLKSQGIVKSDSFAVALWRRRDQFLRVIELYERLNSDSEAFERQFAHLFSPYTA
jgi:hypothetical protein